LYFPEMGLDTGDVAHGVSLVAPAKFFDLHSCRSQVRCALTAGLAPESKLPAPERQSHLG